jgi:hypothetical protein
MRNESFKAYVSSLTRDDNTIWKPIKHKKKTHSITTSNTQKLKHIQHLGQKVTKKKLTYLRNISQKYSPHDDDPNQQVEQDLATPIYQHERLKPFTLKEIEITKLNHKKAPGIDLITAKMLKELPQEGLLNLMYILNAIIRLEYWPKSLKQAQIIMLPKPGKNPTDVTSYRPISLLPTISKVLEKLILKRINKESNPQDWIPNHQFGFRQAHSTIQQCHRVADTINKALENHQFCTAAFLDVSQAFDKV